MPLYTECGQAASKTPVPGAFRNGAFGTAVCLSGRSTPGKIESIQRTRERGGEAVEAGGGHSACSQRSNRRRAGSGSGCSAGYGMLRDLKMLMQAFQTGIRFAAASLPELILGVPGLSLLPFGGEGRGVSPSIPPEPWRGRGRVLLWDNGDWELYQGFVQGWASATFRARWSI